MNKSQSWFSNVPNIRPTWLKKKSIQQKEQADVCVIGSGAGGAVVAKELAEAGLSVVILEAGENHDPSTFNSYEPEMLRRLFWDSGLRCTRDGAIIISQGKGVGGSTVHNLCYAVRPPKPCYIGGRFQRFGLVSIRWSRHSVLHRCKKQT